MNLDLLNQAATQTQELINVYEKLKLQTGFNTPDSKAIDHVIAELSMHLLMCEGLFFRNDGDYAARQPSAPTTITMPRGNTVQIQPLPLKRSEN